MKATPQPRAANWFTARLPILDADDERVADDADAARARWAAGGVDGLQAVTGRGDGEDRQHEGGRTGAAHSGSACGQRS